MKTKAKFTTKVYRLKKDMAPLSYMLPSRHSSRYPLMWFDEENGTNKPLRYARNQKSPFEDEQDGNAILETIVFEDGMLTVQRDNQVLQEFLELHPQKDDVYEEVNNEKDAAKELEYYNSELDAQILAKELPLEKLLIVAKAIFGSSVDRMTTPEIKRDILVYAKYNSQEFTDTVNDPMLDLQHTVDLFFDERLLSSKGNSVYYNLKNNKKLMLAIPPNVERSFVVASFLQSDDGLAMFTILKNALNKDN
jgi:hypothetical protein|tara:strand:+ start:1315 stop:2064 length:750 start_codon:yes stop_codon:yes gene_type:complete